jgi:hypothetical protein
MLFIIYSSNITLFWSRSLLRYQQKLTRSSGLPPAPQKKSVLMQICNKSKAFRARSEDTSLQAADAVAETH